MTKREAVIWLINLTADIGKSEHRDLWHYEKALSEIKEMLESEPERKKGKWLANGDIPKECPFCGEDWDKYIFGEVLYTGELPKYCPNCGADLKGEKE